MCLSLYDTYIHHPQHLSDYIINRTPKEDFYVYTNDVVNERYMARRDGNI